MKNNFTYLLAFWVLLIYSLTVFRAYMPYLSYQVNYKYISTVLCENKARPVLKCHGKCHLQKELKKTAEQESQNNSKVTIQLELEDMPARSFELALTKKYFIRISPYTFLEEKIISPVRDHISPPPQAS